MSSVINLLNQCTGFQKGHYYLALGDNDTPDSPKVSYDRDFVYKDDHFEYGNPKYNLKTIFRLLANAYNRDDHSSSFEETRSAATFVVKISELSGRRLNKERDALLDCLINQLATESFERIVRFYHEVKQPDEVIVAKRLADKKIKERLSNMPSTSYQGHLWNVIDPKSRREMSIYAPTPYIPSNEEFLSNEAKAQLASSGRIIVPSSLFRLAEKVELAGYLSDAFKSLSKDYQRAFKKAKITFNSYTSIRKKDRKHAVIENVVSTEKLAQLSENLMKLQYITATSKDFRAAALAHQLLEYTSLIHEGNFAKYLTLSYGPKITDLAEMLQLNLTADSESFAVHDLIDGIQTLSDYDGFTALPPLPQQQFKESLYATQQSIVDLQEAHVKSCKYFFTHGREAKAFLCSDLLTTLGDRGLIQQLIYNGYTVTQITPTETPSAGAGA